jgi:hypothetical protein
MLKLGNYEFEGPFLDANELEKSPGIFAVITVLSQSPVLVDIDSSENILEAVKMHPRKKAWQEISGPVGYAFVVKCFKHDNREKRDEIVNDIRSSMDIPCG